MARTVPEPVAVAEKLPSEVTVPTPPRAVQLSELGAMKVEVPAELRPPAMKTSPRPTCTVAFVGETSIELIAVPTAEFMVIEPLSEIRFRISPISVPSAFEPENSWTIT